MNENLSPYVEKISKWKMRDILDNYLRALRKFQFLSQEHKNGQDFSFKNLRTICDYLWHAKEGNYLIFRRLTNPKKKIFEKASKLTPNDDEIAFMNNVGLLFHKILVARELKYVLEHYADDSEEYQETNTEFQNIMKRVEILFKQGIDVLMKILRHQHENIPLLTFILENHKCIEKVTGKNLPAVLHFILGEHKIEQAYYQAAKFYHESGWVEQAKLMMEKVLEINPHHQPAQQILNSYLKPSE